MSNHIILLDPSLKDNNGLISDNLGDLIISESIVSVIRELFPLSDIIRLSSHSYLNSSQRDLSNSAKFSFIGGTNLLRSDMITYRQIPLNRGSLRWLFPGVYNLILLGTGWGNDFNKKCTWRTKIMYHRFLNKRYRHSVRDVFTSKKLSDLGIETINTCCPTTWNLNGIQPNLNFRNGKCLFTFTDYQQNSLEDDALLSILIERFDLLTYFPQSRKDLDYILTLPIFKNNRSRFQLLPHDYHVFCRYISQEDFVYIGTRLHAGIKCLDNKRKALILSVDNRAFHIKENTNLPIIARSDTDLIRKWIDGEKVFKNEIFIPIEHINQWKMQFSIQN